MTVSKIHEEVSRTYADALKRSIGKSASCCGSPKDHTISDLAGYQEEMEAFPEAAGASFGCGNPLALSGVEKGQTVLDLGSGAGFDLLIAGEKVGPEGRVIGVDMTPEMVEAARINVAKAGLTHVEVRQGLIEKLPVEDESVDWVISNCVINLSPEKEKVFGEIARVLKPGGSFSISDIVVQDLPDDLRASAAAYGACIGGAISEEEYRAGLESAGLQASEVADRLVYEFATLKSLTEEEISCGCVDPSLLDGALKEAVGKVWSARFTGHKKEA